MLNKIQEAFETVKADEKLKASAMEAVRKKLGGEEKSKSIFGRRIAYGAAVLCTLVLAVGIFGFYSVYTSPVSYVSIDINPSIELVLNRFNRVIETNAYNDDGTEITEAVDVSNMDYEEAIEKIIASEEFSGYLTDEYELVFTVISDKQEEIISGIESTQCYQRYGSACVGADYETREEAREYGMSFGKYKAYQELLKYYPDMTPEDCSELSMNEIKNLILESGGQWTGNSQNNSRCTNSEGETKGQNSGNSGNGQGEGSGNREQEPSGSGNGTGSGSGSGSGGKHRGENQKEKNM